MTRRSVRAAALALLWATLVVTLYYVRHKPVSGQGAVAIGLSLLDLVLAAAIVLAALVLGRKAGDFRGLVAGARLTVQAGLGFGVFALLWLGLSALGVVSLWAAGAVLIGALVLLRAEVQQVFDDLQRALASLVPNGPFEWAAAGLTAVLASVGLLQALAPPAAFDALVYHLALPQEFLRAGELQFTAHNPFWGQPLGAELLYLWAMALGRAQTAAVLGWFAGALTVLGTAHLAARFGRGAGWVAAAALLGGRTLYQSLGSAYVDWWTALYALGVFLIIGLWEQKQERRTLWLAGALAGFAIGAKYTAAVILLAGLVYLALRGRRRLLEHWLHFGCAAVLLVSPWLIKNLLATGAPLYPFYGSTEFADTARQAMYRAAPSSDALFTAPLVPLTSTLLGVEGAPGFAASIGPLLAAFLPAALLAGVRSDSLLRRAWVFFAVVWLLWALGSLFSVFLSQSRLYLAAFPIWALLAAAGFAGLSSVSLGQVRFARVAKALVLLVLALAGLQGTTSAAGSGALSTVLGAQREQDYLASRLGGYYVAAAAAEEVGGSREVLGLWEARGFYCPTACVPDPWLDRWRMDLRRHGSPAAVRRAWAEQGFKYMLLHRAGVEFLQANDPSYPQSTWHALDALLEQLEPVEHVGDGYSIYRITAPE